ncbi:uncharacterized protein LOC109716469 [Ananas comosus]|uniref:Endoplasmic reticulum transmembrane protein n=2 Tax=Ananas comosus TaxID=4615 RepID=A0A6P5FMJ6_ANACO|nr:uncharacterized protein LOC109716469 [Ananas comosus]
MIQLLFTVLAAEAGVVVALLFRTPLRRAALAGLDRLKRGRGPVIVRTIAAMMLVVVSSSAYSMLKIRRRSSEIGQLTPTDQVLFARHLLEASLMAYSLFLSLIIDRLHHYIRELRSLKKNMETVMKRNQAVEEAKGGSAEEVKAHGKEVASLNEQLKQLKSELQAKEKEVKSAEADAVASRRQYENFVNEYDRLMEENQSLQSQLQSIDPKFSQPDRKKNT